MDITMNDNEITHTFRSSDEFSEFDDDRDAHPDYTLAIIT